MLKWVLLPTYRRGLKAYVTKSLTVWVLAVLLKAVGYEVYASPNLLKEDQETEEWSQITDDLNAGDEVMLTVSWYGKTDPFFTTFTPEDDECPIKPQLMPIKMIPYAAFKHLRQHQGEDGFEYLCDAFLYVYQSIRNMVADVAVVEGAVSLKYSSVRAVHAKIHTPFHKQMINAWSPHLLKCPIIVDAVAEYMPTSSNARGWDEQQLLAAYAAYSNGERDKPEDESL